jgi:hypothetical protein
MQWPLQLSYHPLPRLIDAIVEHTNICDEKVSDTVRKMLITGSTDTYDCDRLTNIQDMNAKSHYTATSDKK